MVVPAYWARVDPSWSPARPGPSDCCPRLGPGDCGAPSFVVAPLLVLGNQRRNLPLDLVQEIALPRVQSLDRGARFDCGITLLSRCRLRILELRALLSEAVTGSEEVLDQRRIMVGGRGRSHRR